MDPEDPSKLPPHSSLFVVGIVVVVIISVVVVVSDATAVHLKKYLPLIQIHFHLI